MTSETGSKHWPAEIRYLGESKCLEIDFENGITFVYPAEYLRVESPSAEVQGHGPNQRQIVSGRRYVGVINIEPVGNYAIRLKFDDLHESGIYSWDYLYELGRDKEIKWENYLTALSERGLSREPPGHH